MYAKRSLACPMESKYATKQEKGSKMVALALNIRHVCISDSEELFFVTED